MSNANGVRPGWYADPFRRFESRYFNGTSWTADVANGEIRFVDPLGTQPSPTARSSSATNSAATAAMVLGIVAVTLAWMPFVVVIGALAAVAALAFGVVGMRRAGSADVGRGRAVVGVATGTAGLLAAIVGVMLTLVVIDVYEAYVDPAAHVVTVTDCEVDGSRATVAGLLENRSSESADFSVLIGFARAGTDNVRHTRRAVLNNVAPGEQAAFELQQQVDLDEVDCLILEVTGPLPFGIALD